MRGCVFGFVLLLATVGAGQYFRSGGRVGTGTTPIQVASCDFSGDGRPDLAVANYGGNSGTLDRSSFFSVVLIMQKKKKKKPVSVMINQRDGSFLNQFVNPAFGPYGIACVDLVSDPLFVCFFFEVFFFSSSSCLGWQWQDGSCLGQ